MGAVTTDSSAQRTDRNRSARSSVGGREREQNRVAGFPHHGRFPLIHRVRRIGLMKSPPLLRLTKLRSEIDSVVLRAPVVFAN
jgi:hypothetical protein